jgi:hypothetical protein
MKQVGFKLHGEDEDQKIWVIIINTGWWNVPSMSSLIHVYYYRACV